jgi:multimeric flavodoxin WrbA
MTVNFCPVRHAASVRRIGTFFGCPRKDDMQEIFDAVYASDLLILATPIYSWYCTPPMKTVLDRLVYGMNKYYGDVKGPSLWRGKQAALIATCGYPPEKGADLWEEGIKRYCKHSQLEFLGMLAERHMGYDTVFMDEKKEERAVLFADWLSKAAMEKGKG